MSPPKEKRRQMPEAVSHVYRQLDIAGHGTRDRRQTGGDILSGFSIGDVEPSVPVSARASFPFNARLHYAVHRR